MYSTKRLATLCVLAALGSSAAAANGTEPDTAKPVAPATVPPGVAMSPVWVQLPMAGTYPYVMVPPSLPAYPLPQMTLPPGWGPFVMVWVPVQALQSQPNPAVVDYGPVAETPVVELPEPVPTETVAPAQEAVLAPEPVAAPPAPVSPPAVSEQVAAEPAPAPEPVPDPALAGKPDAVAVPLAEAVPEIDYGPVAPTPVVDLLALTAPPAVSEALPAPAQKTAVPAPVTKKPVLRKKAVRKAPASVAPAKKRMCWNNGVVAPCR